jgi:class 3 adenylate cyclase/tetratricopeptide (TPR) repeat protein
VATCPACGKDNPEGFRFCGFCTAPLTEQPAPTLAEERKVVTVLFCDLVGFTAASEQADPEDVRARIRPYHARLREEIERYSGTVEKFIGDAVMAVFGAPVAHEDDAERAVRAALRILEAIAELNEADATLALQVRIGIDTGEAVVALGARPEEGEGIVTGDVVNTASRLQGAAPVDGIAVSETTFRATERIFEYEPLEAVTVKGKAEPLALFRPLQARARFGSDVTRTHTTPLVGRELEKSLLMGTFERAAQQCSCQLVTLVGEPGAGKSRLCMELFGYLEERPGLTRWRQGRCLPYGDGIAFWALGEIVKAECGILDTDSPEDAEAKLERALPPDEPDLLWLRARLGPLVGVPGEPAAQQETFAAWRRFCESLAASGPAVLVFEDLHWADEALLAFLEHLADWAEGVPLLLLCTARPELYEQHPGFGANARNAQRINLPPLTDEETARLVASLLERALLSAETQQALLERAGGNPLYAEEFVRLLGDRGDLGEAAEVPDSVQALIAARLDTLPAERKSLLQDAAVLGKVFWAGAIAHMGARDPREVELALHELSRKELVRPARASSMQGEAEYGFWHVLVRDVCYAQIPRAARAERHREAASWIEGKAGERLEDVADVLAYHYLQALELARAAGAADMEELEEGAIRYLRLAGERALGLDIERAEQHLALALDLTPPDHVERASLLEKWAQAVHEQGRLQESRQALEEALALNRGRNEPVAVGRVLTRLSLVLFRLGDRQSEEMIAEAVELLETRPAGPELVSAYTYLAGNRTLTGSGHDRKGVAAADRALALAAELSLPEPAFALHWRGLARLDLGEAAGLEDVRRALQLALEQGLGRETAVIQFNLASVVGDWEGPQAALDALSEAVAFCERRGTVEYALNTRAASLYCLANLGQTQQALDAIGPLADRIQAAGDIAFTMWRGLQLRLLAECGTSDHAPDPDELVAATRDIGLRWHVANALAAAAQFLLAQRRPEEAKALLRELDELNPTQTELIGGLPALLRVVLALEDVPLAQRFMTDISPVAPIEEHALVTARAQLAEATGEHAEGARLYHEAAERWRVFGNVPELAYALLGQGRCLAALGDAAADGPLREARELFASMGYRPALAETEALLGEGEVAAGLRR